MALFKNLIINVNVDMEMLEQIFQNSILIIQKLNQMSEKLDAINAALDAATATIAETNELVVKVDADVNKLDAEIQALKDQIANGGTVTEADLDALLVKATAVKDGLASLKAATVAVDEKTEE